QDRARIHLADVVPRQPELLPPRRQGVREDDVRPADEAVHHPSALRRSRIDDDAALARVEIHGQDTRPAGTEQSDPASDVPARRLGLDDVGTEVPEHLARIRGHDDRAHLEHRDTGERSRASHGRSSFFRHPFIISGMNSTSWGKTKISATTSSIPSMNGTAPRNTVSRGTRLARAVTNALR